MSWEVYKHCGTFTLLVELSILVFILYQSIVRPASRPGTRTGSPSLHPTPDRLLAPCSALRAPCQVPDQCLDLAVRHPPDRTPALAVCSPTDCTPA